MGLVCIDQVFVRHKPLVALARFKVLLLQSPRRILRTPLVVLLFLLLALTGLKIWDLNQHKMIQNANVMNFLIHRILKTPPLYQTYLKDIQPPPRFRTIPKGDADTAAFCDWTSSTYKARHLSFLLAHPKAAFKTFNQYSGDIIAWAALNTNERVPNAYVYLYEWGTNSWNISEPNPKMHFSYKIHQWNAWPFFVPLSLLLAAFFLKLKIGRAGLFLPLAFLACTFYLQHGLSILFEGAEDYRHALTGTYALILMPWLFAFGLLQ